MEHNLENSFVNACKRLNALYALKLFPYVVGIPDRLVLLKGGNVRFVELKDGKRGRLSPAQKYVHGKLREYGFEVWVIRDRGDIDEFVRSVGVPEDGEDVDTGSS